MKVDKSIIKNLMLYSETIKPYNNFIKEQIYYSIKRNTQMGIDIHLN